MPTYEYACKSCGEHLEVVQSFSDDALTTCPNCQGELRKVFSAAGIIFKGSGWHIKDYTSGSSSGADSGSSETSSQGSDGPSKESSGGDTKSASKKSESKKSDTKKSDTKKSDTKPAKKESSRSSSTSSSTGKD